MRHTLGICALIFAIFAWGAVVAPSCQIQNQTIANTNQTKNEKQFSYECPSFGTLFVRDVFDIANRRDKEITALSTFFIAVFTIILAGASAFQYRAIMASVQLARNEFLSTHRPKIRVKHLWLTSDIFQAEPITVNLVCVNTGATNAILGQIGIRCHVAGSERVLPADPNMAASLFPRGILEPGLNWTVPNLNTGRILAQHEQTDIQQKRANLYCVGWISYLDGDERVRITGFCRVLEVPQGNAIFTTANARFRICQHPDYEYQD